jgi:DHHC palmitoyltransferase
MLIVQDGPTGTVWFPAFCMVGAVATTATLWAVGCSDPGIIRAPAPPGVEARLCPECAMMVPLSADHCQDCACCVDAIDHHCLWM